jgi:hypothetical protein
MPRPDSRKAAGESGVCGQLGLSANLSELVGVPRAFGVASHAGFPSGRLTSSNVAT